jgi:hypothetical protein
MMFLEAPARMTLFAASVETTPSTEWVATMCWTVAAETTNFTVETATTCSSAGPVRIFYLEGRG